MTRIVITAAVIVHLVASLWHGSAHTHLGIELSTNTSTLKSSSFLTNHIPILNSSIQRAHSSRRQALDAADSIHLSCDNHCPGHSWHTGLDAVCINRPMGILPRYAGKPSFWRVSPLCARVARQY